MNISPEKGRRFWTHSSVTRLETDDPIHYICSRASSIALRAMEKGWAGPPYDPVRLAEHLGVQIVPTEDVADARTVPLAGDRLRIEFNPNRPKDRMRFSIAHEIGHYLFPDCRETVRHRHPMSEQSADEWQVEMLCNLAAAEFLMPTTTFPDFKKESVNIDRMLQLRQQFEVSIEAVLLRVVRLTDHPCSVFAASKRGSHSHPDRYRLDYAVGSRHWKLPMASGSYLPERSVVTGCTAIGFTAKGDEAWATAKADLHIECVGIAPFPGENFPRVVGVVQPRFEIKAETVGIMKLIGDVTTPRGQGPKIIAHVVNDRTPNWGAGVALAIRKKWPDVQDSFRTWAISTPGSLRLGNVHSSRVDDDTTIFHMICQHGYGPSPTPRLRYAALKQCLEQLADAAIESGATVHMPKIGSGHAGGSWPLIQQLIDEVVCAREIPVNIYELPGGAALTQSQNQTSLFG